MIFLYAESRKQRKKTEMPCGYREHADSCQRGERCRVGEKGDGE